jgi:hypothetical protein
MEIDLAGEPMLGCAKRVAHDVSENLICKKTLAIGRSKASEMRDARKKSGTRLMSAFLLKADIA